MKKLKGAIINSATDPAVFFQIGNVFMYGPQKPLGALGAIGLASLAFAIRMTSELKAIGINVPAPKWAHKFIENRGNALATDGAISIGLAFATAVGSSDNTVPYMMACFGGAKLLRGAAEAPKLKKLTKKFMDVAAFPFVAAGHIVGMEGQMPALQSAFVVVSALGMYTYWKNARSKGLMQPDLASGGLNFVRSSTFDNWNGTVAYLFFGAAFGGLDALKKHGGVAQSLKVLKKDFKKAADKIDDFFNNNGPGSSPGMMPV
ncbi:MAG: hypothetical protein AAF182_00605 [Pseudomonadota bacterium]